MANTVGGRSSASSWVEFDHPLELDRGTSSSLEGHILDFVGCAIVISHNRWFLECIATRFLAFEDNSHVEWFEGNFEDYENDNKQQLGREVIALHQLKYNLLPIALTNASDSQSTLSCYPACAEFYAISNN